MSKSARTALVCGISGQDGTYLARLLLQKGYIVYGTSRDAQMASFPGLKRFDLFAQVKLESMVLTDFRSILQVLAKARPDEIYNLAGQSSVSLSFQQPVETLESIAMGTLNLLEAIRFIDQPVRIYNACSGECFGDAGGAFVDETYPLAPRSPYATAKAAAFWEVANYREAYGLYACSGLLFNHESPLRPERFVTRKIISAALRIANGCQDKLRLGNLDIERDWGWAPEYVEAMWLMLQQPQPEDFVIATGESHSLHSFVEHSFSYFGLDWREWVVTEKELMRPTDLVYSRANPNKAHEILNWKAKNGMKEMIGMMARAESGEVVE